MGEGVSLNVHTFKKNNVTGSYDLDTPKPYRLYQCIGRPDVYLNRQTGKFYFADRTTEVPEKELRAFGFWPSEEFSKEVAGPDGTIVEQGAPKTMAPPAHVQKIIDKNTDKALESEVRDALGIPNKGTVGG